MQPPLTLHVPPAVMARLDQLQTHLPDELRKFIEPRQSLQACHLESEEGKEEENSPQPRGPLDADKQRAEEEEARTGIRLQCSQLSFVSQQLHP